MGYVDVFPRTPRPALPAPQAAASSYQAGGTPAAMAALDLRSESRARDTLVAPQPGPAFGQEPFVPQRMDIPQAMSLSEFVRRHYPGITRGQRQPRGTNASVLRSYKAHLAESAKGRKTAMMHNNRMGLGREALDLKRAEFNAKQAAGRVNKDKFATFESMVMDRIHSKPVNEWMDDPAFAMWARMKGAAGDSLPSLKEQIAKQTVLAAAEARELGGQPGPEAQVLVLMTNPLEALKLMEGAKKPKTLKALEAEALGEAIKGKTSEEALEIIRSGGKKGAERSILTPTKFGNEVFGELGGFGSMVKDLDKGVDGFMSVLDRFQSMAPTMDDRQREALTEIIRNKAPTPEEIINAGPAFTGRDGKKRGGGSLTEEQVEMALRFVITPEQRQQLGQ